MAGPEEGGNPDAVRARAKVAFDELDAEESEESIEDRRGTSDKPQSVKKIEEQGKGFVERGANLLDSVEGIGRTEKAPIKFPALPDNFDLNTAAQHLPDEIVGQTNIKNPRLARSAADGRATVNLLREVYRAVYGEVPARVEVSISTYDVDKSYENGTDGTKVTYTLTPAAKHRLIQDFVRQVSGQ